VSTARAAVCPGRAQVQQARADQAYAYQHIDAAACIEACGKVLSEMALKDAWWAGRRCGMRRRGRRMGPAPTGAGRGTGRRRRRSRSRTVRSRRGA